ncbi:MAG: HEPN domain-containing protein [Terricaulis sp.]
MSGAALLKAAYDDFELAISKLEAALDHIENSAPTSEVRVLLLNNAIVALSANLEEGLRALFESYLTVLEDEADAHDWLRSDLQTSNIRCYIKKLRELSPKGAIAISSNLHACLTGSASFKLAKEDIVYNKGNFRSDQVRDTAVATGIREIWQTIADCPEIQAYFAEDRLEQRIGKLAARWNELFDERDLVVHRFSQASGWSKDRIAQAIELSRLVLTRLASCLIDDADGQAINFRGRRLAAG